MEKKSNKKKDFLTNEEKNRLLKVEMKAVKGGKVPTLPCRQCKTTCLTKTA
ncbi:MAG: hypothetical protein GXO80_05460 [Chlorobi bacterium]|nr:hypothetical protein [Chlorobiota bacterium]